MINFILFKYLFKTIFIMCNCTRGSRNTATNTAATFNNIVRQQPLTTEEKIAAIKKVMGITR